MSAMEIEAARRLIEKIRRFVRDDLDDSERPLFATLVAPGVAQAYREVVPDDDVDGFGIVDWSPDALPRALVEALHRSDVRVVGLEA